MKIFEPPLIGPFVEKNGLCGDRDTGASITWTSNGEVYRLDILERPTCFAWSDGNGHAPECELAFEEFLWHCFEHNNRLPEFLNELQPYIRTSGGAPTLARAGEWLNPHLVAKGFSLGIAKVCNGGIVRIPVVWVFGGNAVEFRSHDKYARIDFIDWRPEECKLADRYDCWGTGARSLRRFFRNLVATMDGPLMTGAGQTRMQQVLEMGLRHKKPSKERLLLTKTDKNLSSELRRSLHYIESPLPSELALKISQLSEKSYAALLRTCVLRGLEGQTCVILKHRRLPSFSRENLLTHFINSHWCKVWKFCGDELQGCLPETKYSGYNELTDRVIRTGDPKLVRAFLDSLHQIGESHAGFMIERAFEFQRSDLADAVIEAPIFLPIRDKSLLKCFFNSLAPCQRCHAMAFRLLELGVRPIQAIDDAPFGPWSLIVDCENLPVLKRALELERPTEESVAKLLRICERGQLATFDWLCEISRGFPGHRVRMNGMAYRCTAAFIRAGAAEDLAALERCFVEGAKLADIPSHTFAEAKLLNGRDCKDREGNWIDLVARLIKVGRTEDAEVLKKLKPPKSRLF